MDIQCLDLLAERVIMHNGSQNVQKGTICGICLISTCNATGDRKISFSLDSFLIKSGWVKLSEKKFEALLSTMPATMKATLDGVISWLDWVEWLKRARVEYEKRNFFLAAVEKFKEKIMNIKDMF